jgi:LuxR family maltose regulon positive regulatory protein
MAGGASNQEIANTLVIQLSTVKKHVSNLFWKLGVASRTQAVAQARALSLLLAVPPNSSAFLLAKLLLLVHF